MKRFALLLLVGMSSAATCATAQVVVSRGRAELLDGPACATVLEKSAPMPAGQTARAGKHGVLLEFPEGTRVRLAPGSVFQFGPGVPNNPVLAAPLEAPNATSAVKSILTRRDEQAFRNQSQRNVAHHSIFLRSGALIVLERGKPTDIRVMNATISAEDAYYCVTMLSPERARVTVAQGEVNIASSSAFSQKIAAGEFAILTNGEGCNALAGVPRKITGSDLALADQATLQLNQAGRLEPVGELVDGSKELEPVGELLRDPFLPLPVVGAGPSVPFDLAGSSPTPSPAPRILSTANPSNTNGPVQSPETP